MSDYDDEWYPPRPPKPSRFDEFMVVAAILGMLFIGFFLGLATR